MKDLFVRFVTYISATADIVEAQLYRTGNSASITFKFKDETFNMWITKEKEDDGNGND